ncbi:MAG TPA: CHAD domain-containing protein, partial [Lacipirellulaceae bacterium]|nr:CHAD domain-containing protein [Lacipirellulaceae bacterium]
DWAADKLANAVNPFLDSMPNESADEAALHAFRIRAKAVRYTIELVAPAFGSELRDGVYPIVEELQERLGKVQDHVTARQRFDTWSNGDGDDSRRQLLIELMDDEARRLADDVREFRNWWTDDRINRVRAALGQPTHPAHSTHPAEDSRCDTDANRHAAPTPHPQADHQT